MTIRVTSDPDRTATRRTTSRRPHGPFQSDAAASLRRRRRVLDAAGLHQHRQRHRRRPRPARRRSRSASTSRRTRVPDPAFAGRRSRPTADAGRDALPAGHGGSGEAFLEGRPTRRRQRRRHAASASAGAPSAGKAFPITDADAGARTARSWTSPSATTATRSSRSTATTAPTTPSCARPATTRTRPTSPPRRGLELRDGDRHARRPDHRLQAHDPRDPRGAIGYKVCGFGNTGYDFSDVTYPGKLNNCEGCHQPDTYYPVDPTTVFATTITRGADAASTPLRRHRRSRRTRRSARRATRRRRPQAAHASRTAARSPRSRTPTARATRRAAETCGTCHGPGTAVGREGRARRRPVPLQLMRNHQHRRTHRHEAYRKRSREDCCCIGLALRTRCSRSPGCRRTRRTPVRRTAPRAPTPASRCHEGARGQRRLPHHARAAERRAHAVRQGQLQCEACHGPGGNHTKRVKKGETRPSMIRFGRDCRDAGQRAERDVPRLPREDAGRALAHRPARREQRLLRRLPRQPQGEGRRAVARPRSPRSATPATSPSAASS